MELTPLNTLALHARLLILKKPFNNSEKLKNKLLNSVIKFNLKTLFTSLTKVYKPSDVQLKSALKYNRIYFTKVLIQTYKFLKFFHNMKIKSEIKKEVKKEIFNSVAREGDLDLVKFCHTNNYPWSTDIFNLVAENGHFDCLIYANKNGCRWNKWTCSSAASGGHLDCLI